MRPLLQTVLLPAVPILGVVIFCSPWLTEIPNSMFPSWKQEFKMPRVVLSQGVIAGTVLDSKYPAPVEAFMGLPYAQPPTGDRRFRRAVALQESNKTFKAQKYGPMYEVIKVLCRLAPLTGLKLSWQAIAKGSVSKKQ
jgi:acetylcholinesterase